MAQHRIERHRDRTAAWKKPAFARTRTMWSYD